MTSHNKDPGRRWHLLSMLDRGALHRPGTHFSGHPPVGGIPPCRDLDTCYFLPSACKLWPRCQSLQERTGNSPAVGLPVRSRSSGGLERDMTGNQCRVPGWQKAPIGFDICTWAVHWLRNPARHKFKGCEKRPVAYRYIIFIHRIKSSVSVLGVGVGPDGEGGGRRLRSDAGATSLLHGKNNIPP